MISNQTIPVHENDFNDELHYLDQDGAYFLISKKNRITARCECREEFAYCFTKKSKKIGFGSDELDVDILNKFFEKREKKLNLQTKTIFYKTEYKNDYDEIEKLDDFVIIEPSPFWLETSTSRGLFTLFIRAAVYFYKNNFLESLQEYYLTEKCIPAIQHFMAGNTKPTFKNLKYRNAQYEFGDYDDPHGYYGRHGGFVQFFVDRTPEELNKLLVKP